MIYIVHNRDTGGTEQFSQEQLDTILTSGKFGRYEVIDEIDDRLFTLTYDQAQTLNQCLSSLWELVAYSKPPFTEDGTALTHQELIQSLEAILPQMDQALTPSGTLEVVDKVEQDYPTLNELLPTVGLRLNLDIPTN